jgi:hypothetical protein
VRVNETREFLIKALKKRLRVLLVGKPGIGKTFLIAQACRELGWLMRVSVLPLDDPSTIRGYPYNKDGKAGHIFFTQIEEIFTTKVPMVWFWDDVGQAAESTLKAVMRVLQFGELDGRKLPEHVVIVAATNDVGHGAGVTGLIEPLKSRFHSIINVETHVDDVIQYGLANNWPAWLCAFLKNAPDCLHTWKPSKSMAIDGSCPRGLEYLAEWDNAGIDDPEVWAGCVGKGVAVAAHKFKQLQAELPDIAQVLIDPEGAPVPENPAAGWLVSMAIASRLDGNTFGQAIKYLGRMKGIFRACAIRSGYDREKNMRKNGTLPKNHKPIHLSRDFTAYTTSEEGKEICLLGGKIS